jgi:hypothetical protein
MKRLVLICAALAGACGGAPAVSGTRESGQSNLMNDTFAGQNRCSPKNHERPFVVEWDATDMSSFEARADRDVVFVRYEGCDLKVLDSCSDDSVKGALGAYKAVDWTSGQLEAIDVANEADLYAKLPLGASSLGGRVKAGEKFHMEYYVTGTRTATRAEIGRADLAKIAGCKGATHYVYAYNLGAFALGSASNIQGTVGGSAFGFGAGGTQTSSRKADKKGGELGTCKADTAKETQGCRVPIRLTLHALVDGDSQDAKASRAPDTDASLNKAGQLEAQLDAARRSSAHYDSAHTKLLARDGASCLKELDLGDKESKAEKSRDPQALLRERATCVMLAGQCDAGKKQLRSAFEKLLDPAVDGSPEQIDKKVDEYAATYCQGAGTSPRDQLLGGLKTMYRGAFDATLTTAQCKGAYDAVKTNIDTVKPRDKNDEVSFAAPQSLNYGPRCFVRAGDCKSAFDVYKWSAAKLASPMPPTAVKPSFEALFEDCKGKY